jgi:hypothetical protein
MPANFQTIVDRIYAEYSTEELVKLGKIEMIVFSYIAKLKRSELSV